MEENSKDRVYDLILGQLEKLIENQEKLSSELQKTNLEITRISNLKHTVLDFKEWKESFDKVVNIDDMKKIKDFYLEHQDVNADIIDLYLITKELRGDSDDYKKFKTKTMTIFAVISFLLTTAVSIFAAITKWGQ